MPTTPETWLPPVVVNTTFAGYPADPHIVQLSDGTILVAWATSDNTGPGSAPGTDIIGQLFDPVGNPIGGEFLLNQGFVADDEHYFDVAATNDGGFVLVYEDDPGANDQIAIRATEWSLDASGTPSFVTRTIATSPDAGDIVGSPTVTSRPDGSYMVGYERYDLSSGNYRLQFKQISDTGTVGPEETAVSGSSSATFDVESATLTNGDTVLVYDFEGSEEGVVFSVRAPNGTTPSGADYAGDTGTNGETDFDAAVAALTGGGFVIAWTNMDGLDTDVVFQRYSSAGVPLGGPVLVNGGSSGDNNNEARIVGLPDGGFVVFYDDDEAGQFAIRGQRYNSVGTAIGSDFLVTADDTTYVEATLLEDGRLAVTWLATTIQMAIFDTRDAPNTPVYSPEGWIVGTVGDDVVAADTASSSIHGWDGSDTIYGGAGNDTIFGGEGHDIIDGGFHADDLIGGAGNDRFVMRNYRVSDDIDGGSGIDWLAAGTTTAHSLSMNLLAGTYVLYGPENTISDVENVSATQLSDTVIGSHAANAIFGNGGEDVLHGRGGNDRLHGGADSDELVGGAGGDLLNGGFGADTMQGGAHADIYVMDDVGDVVDESLLGSSGFDIVRSSITVNLATAGFVGAIEGVTLTGSADIKALGNIFANLMTGNAGDNVLNGRAGADNMRGLGGADIYVFDNAGDMADESIAGSSGSDWIVSSVTVNLGNPAQVKGAVEAVTLLGGANIHAYGNLLANNITGNSGNNIINGKGGSDFLTGGGASDAFYFSSAPGVSNIDDVDDFTHGADRLWLDDAVFSSLGAGPLDTGNFHVFTPGDPVDANDYILYSQAAGTLYYDADGSGAGAAQPFAHIGAGTVLTAGEFLVV